MFEGNYTTIKTIMENINRDVEYDSELNIYDVAEWAWKAMDLIGAKVSLSQEETIIDIEDYRGVLPDDYKSIISVRGKNNINMITSSDDFMKTNNSNALGSMAVGTYKIDHKTIFVDLKDGELQIAYNAIRLGDDGFPLIPDETRYTDAVASYIIYKMDYRRYRIGLISRTIYEESKVRWFYQCKSAFNKMVTPNVDKAEQMRKQMSKMIDNRQAHNSGFRTLGIETINKRY